MSSTRVLSRTASVSGEFGSQNRALAGAA